MLIFLFVSAVLFIGGIKSDHLPGHVDCPYQKTTQGHPPYPTPGSLNLISEVSTNATEQSTIPYKAEETTQSVEQESTTEYKVETSTKEETPSPAALEEEKTSPESTTGSSTESTSSQSTSEQSTPPELISEHSTPPELTSEQSTPSELTSGPAAQESTTEYYHQQPESTSEQSTQESTPSEQSTQESTPSEQSIPPAPTEASITESSTSEYPQTNPPTEPVTESTSIAYGEPSTESQQPQSTPPIEEATTIEAESSTHSEVETSSQPELETHSTGQPSEAAQPVGGEESSTPAASTVSSNTFPPLKIPCDKLDSGFYPDPKDGVKYVFCSCAGLLDPKLICAPSKVKPEGRKRRHVDGIDAQLFNCSGLQNGFYPNPQSNCSPSFFACENETINERICPGNTYFDQKSKSCKPAQEIPACASQVPVDKKAGPKSSGSKNYGPKPSPASLVEKDVFDCSKKKPGLYPNPSQKCSDIFYSCFHGVANELSCPEGLKFDPEEEACGYPNDIFVCSGKKKTSTTPASTPKQNAESLLSSEFNCTKDGSFLPPSSKCSNVYYRCVSGAAFKVKCPPGLYYDAENDLCEAYVNVFSCSGKRPTSPEPTTTQTPPTTQKLPIDCSNKQDGDYPDPQKKCSADYYSCTGGVGALRSCPAETYYDQKAAVCDYAEYVPACGGKPRSINETTDKPVPAKKLPFDCEKKHDGEYPAGKCVSHFWVCVTGTTLRGSCPSNTYYDSEVNECGYKEKIPACGGQRNATQTTPSG